MLRKKIEIKKREIKQTLIGLLIIICGACCAGDGDCAYRVKVERKDGVVMWGTAAAISGHTLVTAAHVVADAEEIFIDHEIGWLRCKVVKQDAAVGVDLAVIECKGVELKFIPIDTAPRVVGESATVWAAVAGAKVRALAVTLRRLWDEHRWVCATPEYGHGGSGGPVIKDHKLVGVATGIEPDKQGNAIAGTMVFVASDCIQHVLSPETFAGDVLLAPKRKDQDPRAEVVEPPVIKDSLIARTPEIPRQIIYESRPQVCRTCHAVARSSSNRHWDSDADGHGQGGWVTE